MVCLIGPHPVMRGAAEMLALGGMVGGEVIVDQVLELEKVSRRERDQSWYRKASSRRMNKKTATAPSLGNTITPIVRTATEATITNNDFNGSVEIIERLSAIACEHAESVAVGSAEELDELGSERVFRMVAFRSDKANRSS